MGQDTVKYKEQTKITISDVAEALGISKTTVSRAISGKGRVGETTKQRVLHYIEQNNYTPSVVAKGLAQSKTYNIGWVIPGDTADKDLPFFQRCMVGVSEMASTRDYDVVVSMVFDKDISQLERLVRNNKVDGIILSRTLVEDSQVQFLRQKDFPFVVVGSYNDDCVIQIDNSHVNACKEITSILLMKGIKNPCLIGGSRNHVVNRNRYLGYCEGFRSCHKICKPEMVIWEADSAFLIENAVDDMLQKNTDCIVCMDDYICHMVLNKLHRDGVVVPDQVKVASFYNNSVLDNNQPAITTLQYDPKELGEIACRTLLEYIAGYEVPKKVMLGYEVLLRESTQ